MERLQKSIDSQAAHLGRGVQLGSVWKMAIEIVSFPMKNGGSFHSYVSLPENLGEKISKMPWPWLYSHYYPIWSLTIKSTFEWEARFFRFQTPWIEFGSKLCHRWLGRFPFKLVVRDLWQSTISTVQDHPRGVSQQYQARRKNTVGFRNVSWNHFLGFAEMGEIRWMVYSL